MPPEDNKKKIVIIIIVVIIAVLCGFYAYKKYFALKEEQKLGGPASLSLGGQIYEQVQNPAEKIPETNPYSAKTNPFEEAKTNPFENVYTNPFK